MFTLAGSEVKNSFLSSLPGQEFEQLLPHLERVTLPLGELLFAPYEPIEYVYFPENCIISLVTCFRDGASVESGLVGKEGFAGVAVILGNETSPREATIQLSGSTLKIKSEIFKAVFKQDSVLQKLALRYVYCFINQISQSAACNRHHEVNVRLARWLLMCHDRIDSNQLRITQEFIAQMLGVHRPAVSIALSRLQTSGIIQIGRGFVTIINRAALEKEACECYERIAEMNRNYCNS